MGADAVAAVARRAARRPPRARSSRVDGSAYFSRPGPRVIDGIELLAEIIDPDGVRRHRAAGSAGRRSSSRRDRSCRSSRRFACLWCGAAHTVRGARRPGGLGAALPRLRRQGRRQRVPAVPAAPGADRTRAAARVGAARRPTRPRRRRDRRPRPRRRRRAADAADVDRAMIDYYEARAPEYDDWYLRRGRYARGADPRRGLERRARRRRPLARRACRCSGEIVELAAGTGWWSPLLASRKGELSLYDAIAGAARPGARAPGRPRPARPPPRPRRLGRTGPAGRRRCSRASG